MFDKRLLAFAAHAKKYIASSVALQWVALLGNVALIAALGLLLQQVLEVVVHGQGGIEIWMIAAVAVVAVVSIVVRMVCIAYAQRMGAKAANIAKTTIRQAVYDKLVSLGPGYMRHVATSEAVQVSVDGAEQLEVYYGSYLPQFFYALLAPITLFVCLVWFSPIPALVLLVCVPLIPFSIAAFQTIAKRVMKGYWGSYLDLGASFLENLQGLTTLKIYSADERRHEIMNQDAETFRQATMRLLRMQLNSITIMDLLAFGATAIGVIAVLWQFSVGHVSFAAAFAVIFLSADFFIPMRSLGSLFHVAMNGMTAADKMFEILDAEPTEKGTEALNDADLDIKLTNVTFGYNNTPALRDVTIDIPQGSFVGIVGESGSGKSTLSGLINGRNTGFEGTVTIGGINLEDIDRASLMANMTTVTNTSVIFKGTVRSNLLMASDSATDEDLYKALALCSMDGFVRDNGGLDMPISENGTNLSGGQRQRLAVARALLHDSAIYIFDEATSNIDAESEACVLAAIDALVGTKTIIMISHRLAAVEHADMLYVMDHGNCVESGTHNDLLTRQGRYAELWSKQCELETFTQSALASGAFVQQDFIDEPVQACEDITVASSDTNVGTQRSAFSIMKRLVTLVKPLVPIMILAIILGVLGFVAAIAITVCGVWALAYMAQSDLPSPVFTTGMGLVACLVVCVAISGVLRGPLRYGEQLCNHELAFRILAVVRDKVFGALRALTPAKLEGKDKGNLVTIITSDVELLEVFYAHTLSPAVIAFIVSAIMVIFTSMISPILGLVALSSYLMVGVGMPYMAHKAQAGAAHLFRSGFADINSYVLEQLQGLRETLQYGCGSDRSHDLAQRMADLTKVELRIKNTTAIQASFANTVVLVLDMIMFAVAMTLCVQGSVSFVGAVVAVGVLMSSFGPVLAVAALGSTLQQTLAAGSRVLDILDESPQTAEISGREVLNTFEGAEVLHVNFSYNDTEVLHDVNMTVHPGQIVRVAGKSGSGKSTLCKLLMRFWDVNSGNIMVSGRDITDINTCDLRSIEGYMTQDTHLFTDTLRANLLIVKPDATDEELLEACKKASLIDYVESQPLGLDSPVGELGSALSGGERQRVGLARVFLHDAPFVLLDEPTSNLDSLNEAAVLRALSDSREGKTIILISHRESTGSIADVTYTVQRGRLS